MSKRLIVNIVTASTYDDFIENHGTDVLRSLRMLVKLQPQVEKFSDESWEKIERKLKVYDKYLVDKIVSWMHSPKQIRVTDVAKVAVEIQNRYGTETRMVDQALEDAASLAMRLAKTTEANVAEASDLALAFNMKQTHTGMSKEKIAERTQKHMDHIARRKQRIKDIQAKKKKSTNPETVRRLSQHATKHESLIKKHQEAIKYYKLLASLVSKQEKPKVGKKP